MAKEKRKRKKVKRRALSLFLAAALVVSGINLPASAVTVYAEETSGNPEIEGGGDETDANSVHITADEEWEEGKALDGDYVIDEGVTVTLNGKAVVAPGAKVSIAGGGKIRRLQGERPYRGTMIEVTGADDKDTFLTLSGITLDGSIDKVGSNSTESEDSAVKATGNRVTLTVGEQAVISGNDVGKSGVSVGGIAFRGNGTLNLCAGTIQENEASKYGAGIYISEGTLNVEEGSLIRNNRQYGAGSGIYIGENAAANIRGGTFSGNCDESASGRKYNIWYSSVTGRGLTLYPDKMKFNDREFLYIENYKENEYGQNYPVLASHLKGTVSVAVTKAAEEGVVIFKGTESCPLASSDAWKIQLDTEGDYNGRPCRLSEGGGMRQPQRVQADQILHMVK